LDLGIASAHTARVLSGDGKVVAKRKAIPTTESLSALEAAALEGAPPGTVLEVVMEPTGPAWLPVAVFFISRGHKVFRVPSAKAHDMRRYLSRPPRFGCCGPSKPSSPPMKRPEKSAIDPSTPKDSPAACRGSRR
jgi:hypothetical protein